MGTSFSRIAMLRGDTNRSSSSKPSRGCLSWTCCGPPSQDGATELDDEIVALERRLAQKRAQRLIMGGVEDRNAPAEQGEDGGIRFANGSSLSMGSYGHQLSV